MAVKPTPASKAIAERNAQRSKQTERTASVRRATAEQRKARANIENQRDDEEENRFFGGSKKGM